MRNEAMRIVDVEAGLAASGLFVPTATGDDFEVANPYLPGSTSTAEALEEADTTLFVGNELRVIDSDALDSYADSVAKIAICLQASKPDLVLVPLRGALKLWRQVQPMCLNQQNGFLFEATGLGSGELNKSLSEVLRGPIEKVADKDPLRIAVLDTAKGGHGAYQLALVLRNLHAEISRSTWLVNFHLVVAQGSPASVRLSKLYDLAQQTFACYAIPYEVDDLLVEDWAPAFGLRGFHGGERVVIKPLSEEKARLGIKHGSELYVIESARIYDEVNKLVADRITEDMTSNPHLIQVRDLTQE